MTGSIWRSMLLLAVIVAAVPTAAHANKADVAVQASLTAKANADTSKAVQLVKQSRAEANRHLARARQSMQRAYRITQRVNAKAQDSGNVALATTVTGRFTSSIDTNDAHLEALLEKSSGRIETRGARAMAKNIEMRSNALLASLGSYGEAGDSADPEDYDLDGQIVAHAEAFAEVSGVADSDGVGRRAQAKLEQGMAGVLDTQTELAERFGELYARSSGEGKRRLGEVAASLVSETSAMRSAIEENGQSNAQIECSEGSSTLGSLAVRVESDVRADVGGQGNVGASGEAQGNAGISLISLP